MTTPSHSTAESTAVLNEVLRAMLTADPRGAEQIAAAVVRRLTEVYPAAAPFVPITLSRTEVADLVANLVAAGSRVRVGVDDGFKYDVGWGWSAPVGTVNG